MENVIIVAVLVVVVGLASLYVYKAKKSGKKCIGCPGGGSCSGACGSCLHCGGNDAEKTNEAQNQKN